jgi:hypothetical protein
MRHLNAGGAVLMVVAIKVWSQGGVQRVVWYYVVPATISVKQEVTKSASVIHDHFHLRRRQEARWEVAWFVQEVL